MIKNYKTENIKPCSYGSELGEIFEHEKMKLVDLENKKLPKLKERKLPFVLNPGEYVLGRTIEEFDTPIDLMSIYGIRSHAFRIGLNIICGLNDPGYKGKAVFGIQNISKNKIKLYRGMPLIKTAFVDLKGDAIPVQTKYMGGELL